MKFLYLLLFIPGCFYLSCSVHHKLSKYAQQTILQDSALIPAHIGISIYEPSTEKYWYNYQADKYFVPASNTKLFSLYAGMKYLGDSLMGLQYFDNHDTIFIKPTGDPTFLHEDFKIQKVAEFLKRQSKPVVILNSNWKDNRLGYGWAWDDYNEAYMPERSYFPLYGNVINWKLNDTSISSIPKMFSSAAFLKNTQISITDTSQRNKFIIIRNKDTNIYEVVPSHATFYAERIPFITTDSTLINLLNIEERINVSISGNISNKRDVSYTSVYSQPADSLFKIMMHRSDNFFAEQTLLMASSEKLGLMNDEEIIDAILKNDLKDIPQKPRWIDGSGLSRYNLFSPKDFIYILNRMKNDFGFERLKVILPTGGTGTLKAYYKKDSSFIYAKTGTLSNHTALSGFLITRKHNLLIFSILVNNYQTEAPLVRRAIEKFLSVTRQRY